MYKRFAKEILFPGGYKYPFLTFKNYHMNGKVSLNLAMHVIGFCGKLYPAFAVDSERVWDNVTKEYKIQSKVCFTLEEIDQFVRENYRDKEYESFLMKKSKRYDRRNVWDLHQHRYIFEEFFNKFNEDAGKHGKFFEDNNCPIFVGEYDLRNNYMIEPSKITLNAQLKPFDFVRMFDPYQAFQEISMFMGNMAQPNKPIPHVSDEDMAAAKGFDQWSFRQPPRSERKQK